MNTELHKQYVLSYRAHVMALIVLLENKGYGTLKSNEIFEQKFVEFNNSWKIQAIWIYNQMLEDYNYKSNWNPFHKSSFLAPIQDEI